MQEGVVSHFGALSS